jgi:hypothetical protein
MFCLITSSTALDRLVGLVPQPALFGQAVSKAGIRDNHFAYSFSSDKLFASMRSNEALDMIFQTDMTPYEQAHFSLYDNGAKGTKKKKEGEKYIFVGLFLIADNS